MQNSHAGTIRGLSIAVIILSILTILGLIASLLFLGAGGVALNDPELRDAASYSLSMDPDSTYTMEQLGITEDDAFGMLGILLGLGAVYVFWGIICCIVSLVAGIIGLRNCKNTAKLGGVFGWAIAGAVMSFLYGNIIIMVLLISSAVCASKDRKAATAIPYGQPATYYGAPQQPYGMPQQPYGAPQQPYAAPQQPQAQPQQPYAAPQQPQAQPQQPQQPVDAGTQNGQQQ